MKKIFLGSSNSICEKFFMDIKNNPEIEYCDFYQKLNSRRKAIFFKPKILTIMPNFIRSIIFRKVLGYNFLKNRERYLFVFCNSYELFSEPQFLQFLIFLKRNYSGSKFAFYYYDVVSSCYPELFPDIQKSFDVVLTFNRYCAEKYDIEFYGPICENVIVPLNNVGEQSDIFYAANVNGGAHNDHYRLDLIIDVFKYASDNNLKCIFYLNRINELNIKYIIETLSGCILSQDRKSLFYKQSIIYFEYSSYYNSLAYIEKSRSLLEIVLPHNYAMCTARLAQAMVRNKKLITNCQDVKNEVFYNKNNIATFDKAEEINFDILDMPFERIDHDFSGQGLINHIEYELCR